MERGEHIGQAARQMPSHNAYKISWKERQIFKLAMATLTVLELGVAGAVAKTDDEPVCAEFDVACQLEVTGLQVPEAMRLGPPEAVSVQVPETVASAPPETTTTLPPTTTTTAPPPPPPIGGEFRNQVAPEVLAGFDAMNLTPEGYQAFFTGIDMTWFDYSQSLVDFSPLLVSNPEFAGDDAIPQNATEWVTAHFTAGYTNYNEIGPAPLAIGLDMDLKRLIDFSDRERGHPCCGFNFVIDRSGRAFQLAPFGAKLRHNPPYDGRTTGFEIEAATQGQITNVQYEQASYLVIAMLQQEGKLDPNGLAQYFHGHGEDRDKYRAENPGTTWDVRNDFDAPVMGLWRDYLTTFIRNNPTIGALSQSLR